MVASSRKLFASTNYFPVTNRNRRWLLHSISSSYGLHSWTVAVGDPIRRETYVGLKEIRAKGRK